MRNKDVERIAISFREAVLKAKYGGKFQARDRMTIFPNGCCDDASDLFANFLNEKYGIGTMQECGTYRDDNPYNTTNHAWLVTKDELVIDITADQFNAIPSNEFGIYVGEKISFYKGLERIQRYENCNIFENERLSYDYIVILENM